MEQQSSQADRGPSFEEALAQLRETVQTLEEGDISLEEATRLLTRGAELARTCNDLLAKAERQVSRVRRNFQEQPDVGRETLPPVAQPQQELGVFDGPPR